VVVEDHWPEGGLAGAVEEAFTVSPDGGEPPPLHLVHLAVRNMPGSGTPAELLAAAGIDASHIAAAVRSLVVTH
jgi:transketolase